MRLTTLTDYALRLLTYVAQRPERLCTIREVARAHDISEAHLMKITHQLALGGWVLTVRGRGGGMRLAREPENINLGDLVRRIETDFLLVECLGERSACTLTGACGLTSIFRRALDSFLITLDQYTLADLLPAAPASGVAPVRVLPRQY